MKIHRITPLLLLAVLLLGACDSNGADDDADEPGAFNVAIEGAVTAAFSGEAAFGVVEDDPEFEGTAFVIGLSNAQDDEDGIILVGTGRPGKKTYQIDLDAEDAGAMLLWSTSATEGAVYFAESGTLTLTDVRSDELKGRFAFDAVNILDEEDAVAVSGTFSAREGEVDDEASFSADAVQARVLSMTVRPR